MNALKQLLTSILCALLFFNPSFTLASSDKDDFSYTVKKNDTVWAICKIYVSDPLCWKKLVEYNQLKNPRHLPPRSIIRIPKAWLKNHPTTALVIAVEGQVSVARKGNQEQKSLIVGDLLSQEDVVQALNGTAMIKFADESRLLLKANSTIRMASLQFYDRSQLVNTRVELLKGRVKAQVEKISNKNSRYEIATPAAVAAVRGTEFRVSNEKNNSGNTVMRTELLTGALAVVSDNNNKNIIAGQAVMAVEGEGVFEPVSLLSRPLLEINGARSFQLPYDLQWKPIEGAVSYKVILITDSNQLWEKTTKATLFTLQNLDSGRFELLIRGVDSQGFEGRDRRLKINLP
ncbi:MAG: hypothetical protein ACJAYV_000389 [Oleispira sp.]|jgi:hypothetical protein